MYSVDLKNVIPQGGLTCLFAKATPYESNFWHRGNLVRGLPSKLFEINQTCVACQKGKQHRASCKTKTVSSISQPLQMLHMDLFGPTFVKSLMKKMCCLVVTDDFNLRVKVIKCDNGTEFKNKLMNQFCEMKGIKREFSVARTPQQNGVAERKNRTLIEAARTMLADSKLPTTFWAEAVNTACYVQNRVLVIKPHNKTPYELFLGRKPALSFMRPFGCPVTILNTIDHLGSGPNWLFDIDSLTKSMNYKPVVVGNQSNSNAGTKACDDAGKARMETVLGKDYILLLVWPADLLFSQSSKHSSDAGFKPPGEEEKKNVEEPGKEASEVPSIEEPRVNQEKDDYINSTNNVNTASDGNNTNNVNIVSSTVNAVGIEVNADGVKSSIELPIDLDMPELEEIVYSNNEDVGAEADINNLSTFIPVSPITTTRVHKDHPVEQIIGDLHSAPRTRRMTKNLKEHEPKRVVQALKDPSWIEAMQEELLQFKLQEVWTLVELPNGKRAIGTKWVFKNKKDERGIMIKNKARLVAQGYTQEERIDYDEVFSPATKIEAIRLFLAYALFKDFVVYQMDVKSAFLYGKIEEEVYICQPPGFEDPDFPDKVYKVEKALYGLHQAPRAGLYTKDDWNGMKKAAKDGIEVKSGNLRVNAVGHYLVLLREKNVDFAEIVDLLNANPIRYALTVSPTIYVSCIEQFWSTAKTKTTKTVNNETQIHAKVEGKTIVISKSSVRRDLQFDEVGEGSGQPTDPQHTSTTATPSQPSEPTTLVANEAVHEERGDSVERAATTTTSLDAEQDSGNINRTQSTAMPNDPLPKGISSGGRPRRQETMGDRPAQTRFESLSKQSNDPPLSRFNTLGIGEDNMKLKELMELCTKLSERVLDLETTKTAQAQEIASLKKRVKKLEKRKRSRTPGMTLFKIESDVDEDLDNPVMDEAIKHVYEADKNVEGDAEQVSAAAVDVSTGDAVNTAGTEVNTASALVTTTGVSVSTAEPTTPPTTTVFEDEDLTIAQTLVKMKSEKSKVRGVVMKEPSETATRPTVPPQQHDPKDKGKAKMVEQENPLKKKDQIKFDEEVAQ
ncbi:hypothetical protein Tco_1043617 [Tanacetum coccineum]|uniref:Integrase catalytic domain-containing protein n=1 Tax=Tanacetum coccineum TaxID=301880 RepID=A0ABQ5GMK5_9ASTR